MKDNHQLLITPRIHSHVAEYLADHTQVRAVYERTQGTVNIVFPGIIRENYQKFKKVFDERDMRHQIQFAHKPNKSSALVSALAHIPDARIDVASSGELESVIRAGFEGIRISGGGPKNATYISSLIKSYASIVVDSIGELHTVMQEVVLQGKQRHPILIRLNVDSVLSTGTESRFGILAEEVEEVLEIMVREKENIQFVGFAFHINADAKKMRKSMFEKTLEYTLRAGEQGLRPTEINIGGGFGVNYCNLEAEWNEYTSALVESVQTQRNHLGWNKSGLGYWSEQGVLRGSSQFAEQYKGEDQYQELASFLDSRIESYRSSIGEVLADHMLCLTIEPGRALLDSAGITVTRVLDKKKTSLGNNVLVVDMNRSQLGGSDQMYMLDPVIISNNESAKERKPFATYIAGNLCMKSDMVMRRKIYVPHEPHCGDLLIFINTAGYFMDFTESKMLMQPIAPKYAASLKDGEWECIEDTLFA